MPELPLLLAIAHKDLLQELRSKAATVATLFFAAVTLVVLAFALGPDEAALRRAAPGALWVALAFAGIISAAQSYQAELDEGAFEGLLLYPIPRAVVFLGKLLANWLYMSLLGLVMLPVALLLFGSSPAGNWLWLALTVLLGSLGFAVVASFYAALTANLRARESLLPVLMFPVVVPVLLAAVRASGEIMLLDDLVSARGWLQLLVGFDLVYLVVTTALFSVVVEE